MLDFSDMLNYQQYQCFMDMHLYTNTHTQGKGFLGAIASCLKYTEPWVQPSHTMIERGGWQRKHLHGTHLPCPRFQILGQPVYIMIL